MDTKQFRQIIREEVRKAMQDELREILVEAVEIASRPESSKHIQNQQPKRVNVSPKIEIKESEVRGLSAILAETASSMDQEDYHNVLGAESMVTKPDMLEESVAPLGSSDALPDFVSRAAQIFAAANEKDRERHGV